jgi:hypothetical protein
MLSDQDKKDLLIFAAGTPLLIFSYAGLKYINDHNVISRVARCRQEAVVRNIEDKYNQTLTHIESSKGKTSQEYQDTLAQKNTEKIKQGEAAYKKAELFMHGCIGGASVLPMAVPLLAYKAYCSWYQ